MFWSKQALASILPKLAGRSHVCLHVCRGNKTNGSVTWWDRVCGRAVVDVRVSEQLPEALQNSTAELLTNYLDYTIQPVSDDASGTLFHKLELSKAVLKDVRSNLSLT